jgi:hypothetical protein
MGGVIAPMFSAISTAGITAENFGSNPILQGKAVLDQIGQRYMGYSIFPELSGTHGFNGQYLLETYGGLMAGVVGHMLANKFGVNRNIAKILIVGKYIQL